MVNHRSYNAFGVLTDETANAVDCLFGYTGKMFDDMTELQNNVHRWYNPELGKWLSEDPIGFNGMNVNLYRYVRNVPVASNDPLGLCESGDVRIDEIANSKVTSIVVYPVYFGESVGTKPLPICDINAHRQLGESVMNEILMEFLLGKIPTPSTAFGIEGEQVVINVVLDVTYRVAYYESRCVPKRTWTGFCSWNTEYVWEADPIPKFKTVTARYTPPSGKIGKGPNQDSTTTLNDVMLLSFIEAIIREQLGDAINDTSGELQNLIQAEPDKSWWK